MKVFIVKSGSYVYPVEFDDCYTTDLVWLAIKSCCPRGVTVRIVDKETGKKSKYRRSRR